MVIDTSYKVRYNHGRKNTLIFAQFYRVVVMIKVTSNNQINISNKYATKHLSKKVQTTTKENSVCIVLDK